MPFSRFDPKRSFAKTGSGHTKRKRIETQEALVCITGTAGNELNFESWFDPTVVVPHAPAGGVGTGFANPGGEVRKRISLRNVYTRMISLPRQAQDKHRENSRRDAFWTVRCDRGRRGDDDGRWWRGGRTAGTDADALAWVRRPADGAGEKTAVCFLFSLK
eukprot:COSAG06_NODE_4410_length_4290_cov_1.978764_1_plen_161_part_00